ncbi:arpin isoform X1 [Mirounga angustirostris]|uniref:arpin isoform X1 n=1 Tax=Mirounga leonina TaxID=9715 RepID=UPI00156BED78|nr:arpin isoform X1 [Mirounga leonina]XP_045755357.1 arpin isoform X1 [Mirounga angustirostris]
MSRIYHDCALRNKAVRSARLPGAWDPAVHQGGNGVLLEGELVDVSRHRILDARDRKEHYYVLYIRPSRIHRRKFDPKGNEIEPNFSATRKVNTGFLMSSYKVEATGDTDRLTPDGLKALIQKSELLALTESLTPDQTVAFWMSESEMEAMDLEPGVGVRLKTRGDGPFLGRLRRVGVKRLPGLPALLRISSINIDSGVRGSGPPSLPWFFLQLPWNALGISSAKIKSKTVT